ncbi:hypothetical protein DNTS_003641 [Danionella cerebrum]|uniref:SKA complex subunit 1 n=1 Tax=Danionella cerebrum TaxID=2873325 RepID=A0A553NRL2_9TELE|nr:hypothetical protein DNTS_003641 [Danionella translucida]
MIKMNHCELEEVTHHINDKISTLKRLLELRAVAKDPDKRGMLLKIEQEVTCINDLLDRFERYVVQQRDLLKHLKALEDFFHEDELDAHHMKDNVPPHMPKRGQHSNPHGGEQVAVQSRQPDAPSAPQVTEPPRKAQRNQIKEMEIITVPEFDNIPPYMKGRVTYDQLNTTVESINKAVAAKYKILHQSVKTLNNASRSLQQRFKDQETKETKGQFFIVEQDIKEFTQLKVDKRFVSMLNMLRHCQRFREVRGRRQTMAGALRELIKSPLLVAAIFISGIGGTFQYGFNISVLNSPSFFIKELVNSTCQQRYGRSLEPWQLSLIWSFIVSVYSIGGLAGTLYAGRVAGVYGRKTTLLMNNILAVCGGVLMLLSKTAGSFEMIMVARVLYGVNAGVGLTVHTMYILECAPKRLRGMVGVSVASFASMGKFTGQLLGISEVFGAEDRWIWLLSFSGAAGLLQLLTLPFLPESPRYLLLEKADKHSCETALLKLWGREKDPRPEVEEMLAEHAALKGVRIHSLMNLLMDQSVRWQLLTLIVTFVTVQLCGINAVTAGIAKQNLRYAALGTGLCEVSTSIFCGLIIEHTGKRVLLFRGYLFMAATLLLLTLTLYLQDFVSWMPYCSMVLIFMYIFFFSTGPAAVTAPLPGEIFTQSYKPPAFMVAYVLNWTGLFLVGMLFPLIVEHLDYFCFLIFFIFCFFSGVFVWFHVPETKNKTVLEISEDFKRMHQKRRNSLQSKLGSIHINDIQITTSTKF